MIRQHEALRVPSGWNGQDKALVMQIERVLTDLYRLFGIVDESMVTEVAYNATTKKLTVTINNVTSDIVSVATLDENGKIPANQLPSYVDDVEEYEDLAHFPLSGESDKIYVAMDTGFTYRWSGTQYVRLNTYDPATQSASGLMSAADKTKLDGIETGAQVNPGNATQSAAGLMSATDKTKLDGIESGAQVNPGNATQSAAGLMSATDKAKLDGVEAGAQVNPGDATTSASGLMSASDKTKLDGIATGANASTVAYDGTNKKITITVNGSTSDVVTVSTIKSALGAFTHNQLAGV